MADNLNSKGKVGTPAGVRRTALVLSAFYLVDSWGTGQGIWSLLLSFGGVLFLVIGALLALVRRRRAWAASRARRAMVFLLLAAATVATMRFHAWTGEARANQVIEACRAYHATHERYPARLNDLVPEFLKTVPRAKYTLMWGKFSYIAASPESHTLMYVEFPPFGRRLYDLETERWRQLD